MEKLRSAVVVVSLLAGPLLGQSERPPELGAPLMTSAPLPAAIDGVLPGGAAMADGARCRSQISIRALMPWSNRLWAVASAATDTDEGLGLYEIGADLRARLRPESVTGTYANRMVHWESDQAFIGPYAIKADGTVRTLHRLKDHAIAATTRHLQKPESKVYFLTVDGLLFEVDVDSLGAQQLFDLGEVFALADGQAHFTGAFTAQGRVVVANAAQREADDVGSAGAGLLAEYDGTAWRVVERSAFAEVAGMPQPPGKDQGQSTVIARGWDRSSVILRVLRDGAWSRYLLPRGSHSFERGSAEWMRIRPAPSGALLMDAHGLFYELPVPMRGNGFGVVRPIASHAEVVNDFCHYRGLFVMAGAPTDTAVGQPQSNLRFGHIDDLWRMGKPAGWGGPWWDTQLEAGAVSDPFLMTAFESKTLHVATTANDQVRFDIEVDFRGDGTWHGYAAVTVPPSGYAYHVFPAGFAAHWVRLKASGACRATAQFIYQ